MSGRRRYIHLQILGWGSPWFTFIAPTEQFCSLSPAMKDPRAQVPFPQEELTKDTDVPCSSRGCNDLASILDPSSVGPPGSVELDPLTLATTRAPGGALP